MANSATYKHLKGVDALSAALQTLSRDMRTEILEEGVQEAIEPILEAAKRNLRRSVRTGALYTSMTTKVKNYPFRGIAVGLVGPDRAYYNGREKAGKIGAMYAKERPANYAHLIEFGHIQVSSHGGTLRKGTAKGVADGKTSFVPPRPFLRPAVLSTAAAQEAGFFKGIAAGFERTRKKMEKAGTHSA